MWHVYHFCAINSAVFSLFKFELRFHIQRYFFIFTYLINCAPVMYGARYFMWCDLGSQNNAVTPPSGSTIACVYLYSVLFKYAIGVFLVRKNLENFNKAGYCEENLTPSLSRTKACRVWVFVQCCMHYVLFTIEVSNIYVVSKTSLYWIQNPLNRVCYKHCPYTQTFVCRF